MWSLLEHEGDDVEEAFGLTFKVTYSDVFGELQACNLKKDGDTIPVTKDNVQVRFLMRGIKGNLGDGQ